MKDATLLEKMELPEGIEAKVEDKRIIVKGEKGEVEKNFRDPKVKLKVEGREIAFYSKVFTKREKKLLGTYKAHLRNMFKGVLEGHIYKLKICSGHFPMNVSLSGDNFEVKNFFGEKIPRTMRIREGVKGKVEGEYIVLEGVDKERVAQTAAAMERLTSRASFDKRIFQDGIYIVDKDGKEIA